MNNTPEKIREALAFIPASIPRDEWARVGMAIKSEYPDSTGFELFDAWSQSDPDGYNPTDVRDTWKSVNASGGIGIGTVFHLAKANGYTPTPGAKVDPATAQRLAGERAARELLATLRKVEERGAVETADRGLMLARQVWRYGVATGRVSRDITADLKGALQPYRGKHFAAITDPARLGELLRAIKGYKGGPIVRAALQLAPMLFQRPGELRAARWEEIDLQNAMWTIPAARMKRRKDGKEHGDPHLVPLPTQAVRILEILKPYTESTGLVFPGERQRDRPISENSVRVALISMGYTPDIQTWHGFRATARTMLAERLEFDPLLIEAQLAHAVKDANGRAYNRTTYLKQRRDMMQRWADYLDKLAAGADVIELKRA